MGHRRSLDPALLWLWPRPVATAPIRPLAWEPPYAVGAAQRNSKKKTKKKKKKVNEFQSLWDYSGVSLLALPSSRSPSVGIVLKFQPQSSLSSTSRAPLMTLTILWSVFQESFLLFFTFFFFWSFCYFFGPLLRHMEVPRLGVVSEL